MLFATCINARAGCNPNDYVSTNNVIIVDFQNSQIIAVSDLCADGDYLLIASNDLGLISELLIVDVSMNYITINDNSNAYKSRYRCIYTHKARSSLHANY
jgi:hypothetical protein